MNNTFLSLLRVFISFFIIIVFVSIITIFSLNNNPNSLAFENNNINSNQIYSDNLNIVTSNYGFIWPIKNKSYISSNFGKRKSPTFGASSFHYGIDIPSNEGTPLYAIYDGIVIFASWGAGGGYTITLKLSMDFNDNFKVSYCHVSPVMYVKKGDVVNKGSLIGTVGPKNVYGIKNNPYKDSNGNPTNGATTGCHLHFAIKLNEEFVNPLNYYNYY